MPKPKTTTPKPEAKGEEQEQPAPETEEAASPPEVEAEEQRGEETPDPLTGFTAEQLRDHPLYKEASADLTATQKEAQEKAYRDGQSAGAKQADEKTRQYHEREEALKAFDDLEAKRLAAIAGDPEADAAYAKAMGDPKVKEAYERGRSAKQGPGAQEIATNAIGAAMTEVYQPLKQHPLLKDMTEEEHEAIRVEFLDKPQPFTQLAKRYCELIVERGTAAGRVAEDAKQLKDAHDQGHRDAYDELGLDYPAEPIEGEGTTGRKLPKKEELDGMSQEELVALEEEGKLDQILAEH